MRIEIGRAAVIMRFMKRLILLLILLGFGLAHPAARAAGTAPSGRVVKVLPFFLNLRGHDSLSPSLFERDAYQFYLLQHPNEVSGVRYDVQCRVSAKNPAPLTLKVELRAMAPDGSPRNQTLTASVKPSFFTHWIKLPITGQAYHDLGSIVAWRATLWSGDQQLSEQKSFLW